MKIISKDTTPEEMIDALIAGEMSFLFEDKEDPYPFEIGEFIVGNGMAPQYDITNEYCLCRVVGYLTEEEIKIDSLNPQDTMRVEVIWHSQKSKQWTLYETISVDPQYFDHIFDPSAINNWAANHPVWDDHKYPDEKTAYEDMYRKDV